MNASTKAGQVALLTHDEEDCNRSGNPSLMDILDARLSRRNVLRVGAAYLALLHGTTTGRFLVEEPENGVHPHALLQIADALRAFAAHGRQVVMTTHSPVLLNYIDAANIRIVPRSAADSPNNRAMKSTFSRTLRSK